MKEGIQVSPELLRDRRLKLVIAALLRLMLEEGGPATENVSEFKRGDSAEVVQLENPRGGERWEMIMSLDGLVIFLRQLFYSGAGKTWQVGREFHFHVDELKGEGMEMPINDEVYLGNDQYYDGLIAILGSWPVAKWYVAPLEDKV